MRTGGEEATELSLSVKVSIKKSVGGPGNGKLQKRVCFVGGGCVCVLGGGLWGRFLSGLSFDFL